MEGYICAIDQGTTSSRAIIFSHSGEIIAVDQKEFKQIYPKPGWVEHDPIEIWEGVCAVIKGVLEKSGLTSEDIKAIGITNQRETVTAWDWLSGEPLHNAIVWQDQRTSSMIERLTGRGGINRFMKKTGLPLSPYFSASKMKWLIDNCNEVAEALKKGSLCFGTMDSWLVYKLTGGVNGGQFATDTTNASRTFLMDINTLNWDEEMLNIFNIPSGTLPRIMDSIPEKPFGFTEDVTALGPGIPIAGILGDQQAALFGQACFEQGECKCTYGTGCFLLFNTGTNLAFSENGLLSTIAYSGNGEPTKFALEGSVAIAGSLVQWFRDNIGLIKTSSEIEDLAAQVEDSGGAYIVPAFSGLFAPYWRADARGIIAGLTGYTKGAHIARAVLEATAFQTMELLEAMKTDSCAGLDGVKVDGGMTVNEILMQFQADIAGIPVIRPVITETTALGAAYAAGLAVGFWENKNELKKQWSWTKNGSRLWGLTLGRKKSRNGKKP